MGVALSLNTPAGGIMGVSGLNDGRTICLSLRKGRQGFVDDQLLRGHAGYLRTKRRQKSRNVRYIPRRCNLFNPRRQKVRLKDLWVLIVNAEVCPSHAPP